MFWMLGTQTEAIDRNIDSEFDNGGNTSLIRSVREAYDKKSSSRWLKGERNTKQ